MNSRLLFVLLLFSSFPNHCVSKGFSLEQRGVAATVVDKLQTVERRLSGTADEALARLRGALPSSTPSDYFVV